MAPLAPIIGMFEIGLSAMSVSCCCQSAEQIKDEIRKMSKVVFDVVAEDR